MVLVILILLLIGSLWWLRWSVRGVRVDDHPLCRACGFDLVGRPDDSWNCPECGASLRSWTSTTCGHYVPRRRIATLAAVLTLFLATGLALLGYSYFRGVSAREWVPSWWIRWEVERSLARQADKSQPWDPKWGDLAEEERKRGRVNDEQWDRYIRNGFDLDVVVRPVVAAGEPIPVRISPSHGPRIGRAARISGQVSVTDARVDVDQVLPSLKHKTQFRFDQMVGMWSASGGLPDSIPADELAGLPNGRHTLNIRLSVALNDGSGKPHIIERSLEFEQVSPEEARVRLVKDDDAIDRFIKSVEVGQGIWIDGTMICLFSRESPSVPIVARAFLRADGEEIPCNGMSYGEETPVIVRSQVISNVDVYCKRLSPQISKVDLILRPAPDLAAETVDIMEILDGEIVIPAIPVDPNK